MDIDPLPCLVCGWDGLAPHICTDIIKKRLAKTEAKLTASEACLVAERAQWQDSQQQLGLAHRRLAALEEIAKEVRSGFGSTFSTQQKAVNYFKAQALAQGEMQ